MKLATRINSFLPDDNNDMSEVFTHFQKLGLEFVDLNFTEHTKNFDPVQMKQMLDSHNLKLNGVALRFKEEFVNGDLGNQDEKLAKKAIILCKEAADYCRSVGGNVVTIWMAHDGFDYNFQINYLQVWKQLVSAFQTIADYAPDLKISIEYKPLQPRAYAFVDSMGVTGMMIKDINRENVGVTLDYCHMLMKHENPAFAADIFGSQNKLFGVHLNDGYGMNDDGLMIGTASPFKTIEFIYYLKKHHYNGMIYFDTFPVIEDASDECQANINMVTKINHLIDSVGMEKIKEIISKNSAIEAQKLMIKFLGE